jgi:hypothetical protein
MVLPQSVASSLAADKTDRAVLQNAAPRDKTRRWTPCRRKQGREPIDMERAAREPSG